MSLFSVLFDLPEIILFFLSFDLYHFFEIIVVPVTSPEEFSFAFDQIVENLRSFSLVSFEHISE